MKVTVDEQKIDIQTKDPVVIIINGIKFQPPISNDKVCGYHPYFPIDLSPPTGSIGDPNILDDPAIIEKYGCIYLPTSVHLIGDEIFEAEQYTTNLIFNKSNSDYNRVNEYDKIFAEVHRLGYKYILWIAFNTFIEANDFTPYERVTIYGCKTSRKYNPETAFPPLSTLSQKLIAAVLENTANTERYSIRIEYPETGDYPHHGTKYINANGSITSERYEFSSKQEALVLADLYQKGSKI